jgi:hypothetical protein
LTNERRKNGAQVADELRRFQTSPRKSVDDVLGGFYVFLDTRSAGDVSDSGDLLLVEEDSKDQQILEVRSMNFASIKVKENPVEWLDRYTSALLRRLQIG